MTAPALYYDLGSPYAYLAVERAHDVLGVAPELEPILLGAVFAKRGRGSWALTPERDSRIAEIERRAAAYGLPPLRWPEGWPKPTLRAMRAATWAAGRGAGEAFARTAFRMAFAEGRDITAPEELSALGGRMGLDGRELLDATGSQEVKDLLRERTEEAWELGVRGVPSLLVEGEVFFGDERLESAAARLRG